MVEFSLIAIALLFLVFAVLDGSLLIFSVGTARFAAGEGARIGAERGNATTTDTEILSAINGTALGTTNLAVINEVDVFRLTLDSSNNLVVDNNHYNAYKPNGVRKDGLNCSVATPPTPCWPPNTRNVINGQSDFLGVQIKFTYYWKSGIFAPAPPVQSSTNFYIRLEPQNY
jgi:hypothetical protein